MHIISESVLMLFAKTIKTLVETTACQRWRVFLIHNVDHRQEFL